MLVLLAALLETRGHGFTLPKEAHDLPLSEAAKAAELPRVSLHTASRSTHWTHFQLRGDAA